MSLFRDQYMKRCILQLSFIMIIVIITSILELTPITIIVAMTMFATAIWYLYKREKLYQECGNIVERYEEGDFSVHLSKNQEGSFFSFLSQIDRLAMSLQGLHETEKDSRELINKRISDISHQLKTPLSALLMYNEIMEQEPENTELIKNFNLKSKNSLERMQQLIQTLLIMTRLDAGSIVFEKGNYYTGEIVRESVRDLLEIAQRDKKQVIFSGSEEDMICCDKKWTMEAISNIVKNALEHTGENGEIHISWSRLSGVTRIIIKDNGTGIKSEDIYHIFKRFYRSADTKSTGVGLGLPLAKSIVEEQGGTILLESIWGEGTTMTLSFLKDFPEKTVSENLNKM